MTELTITLTNMGHGGLAIGRDKNGRAIFVPFAMPGETVRVRIPDSQDRFARAELIEVVKPARDRTMPRCRHYGICGLCHFQHMVYDAQLRAKEDVVRDQLTRVGGIRNPPLRPLKPFPQIYDYRNETILFAADGGGLGYWSPVERRIFRVEMCPILLPRLQELLIDFDVDLAELRKLSLRAGDEDETLAALEVENIEPPELTVDFPISVAIVLPDRTAAALIGDPFLRITVKDRPLRISPGVAFPPSPAAAEMIIDAVISLAEIKPNETILMNRGDSGWLTAALADRGAEVTVIETNSNAVADMVENLDDFDKISIYEGQEDNILSGLDQRPDVVVTHQEQNLSPAFMKWLSRQRPERLVTVSEVGVLAKDAKGLGKLGYRLDAAAPLDTRPQAYQVDVVSLWVSRR